MMGVAQSLSLGITSVIVEDTRVAGHHQTSSLHVVLPDTLRLYLCSLSQSGEPVDEINPISSVSRWFVVCGRNYLIFMKVFSRGPDGQEIYLTEVTCAYLLLLPFQMLYMLFYLCISRGLHVPTMELLWLRLVASIKSTSFCRIMVYMFYPYSRAGDTSYTGK